MRVSSVGLKTLLVCSLALSGAACGGSSSKGAPSSDAGLILTFPDAGQRDTGAAVDTGAGPTVDAGVDAASDALPPPTDAELNTFPAFAPNVPQVQKFGGQVWANPVFIPVIFAGDEFAAQIPGFIAAIGQSDYWKAAVSEYGVGAGVTGTPIILNETLPSSMTDQQIQTWLDNHVGTDPRFGAIPGTSVFDAGSADGGPSDAGVDIRDALAPKLTVPQDAIYVLFFPDGTSVTEGNGTSCQSFGGYHNSFYYSGDGSTVVYALIPRCGSFGNLKGLDAITSTTSHELAEAATDPDVGSPNQSHAAYAQVDTEHLFWQLVLGGGEIGDLCAQFSGAFYKPTEASLSSYWVQRIWSNKAAAAGQDPCVPALPTADEPYYFNTMPNFSTVPATYNGFNFNTVGVSVPTGQTSTIELDLFSNAPTGGQEWQVQLFDANAVFQGSNPDLTFTPMLSYGANGYKLQVQVTNLGNDGQSTHPFIVESTLGASTNMWIGVVTN